MPDKRDAMRAAVEALEALMHEAHNSTKPLHTGSVASQQARSAISLLRSAMEEGEEPVYGSTDLTDGIAIAGLKLTDGDKRLVTLVMTALGVRHPAMDDLVALLFRASPTADKDAK